MKLDKDFNSGEKLLIRKHKLTSEKSNSDMMNTICGIIVALSTFNWIWSSVDAVVWLNTVQTEQPLLKKLVGTCKHCENFKMYSKDVLKTSAKHILKTSLRRLQRKNFSPPKTL